MVAYIDLKPNSDTGDKNMYKMDYKLILIHILLL
jgi:hypothetical protein